MDETAENEARVLAHSPGRYPILVVELSPGDLRTFYYETGYNLDQTKPVTENWLWENAIGRHCFVEVDPPYKVPVASLRNYVRREFLEEP
jgi:hypothetical protein